jgi:hypothetical protein
MIIVNFSTPTYQRGQKRLQDSIPPQYKTLMFHDYGFIGSPTHQASPYEFKIHAIEKALLEDDIVLWVDASMYRVGDLGKIETLIQEDGYFMEEAGHYVGRWTNAHTRNYFKLTDQESIQETGGMIMFSAGLLGLNLKSEVAMKWFYQWKESALAGCFAGSWEDHRHDMTCGSIIAQRLGMKYQRGGSHLSYVGPGYGRPEEGTVFLCQGML